MLNHFNRFCRQVLDIVTNSSGLARPRGVQPVTPRQARLAVALLFGVNFLNYIDRYVAAAVLPLLQKEFGISDQQGGYVVSVFMVAYMIASPFAGVLADRYPRRYFVGGGVLLWSLATMASGFSGSFRHLLAARSFIGIGEAGFGGVAPTLISDLFPKERRGRRLAYFYVAITFNPEEVADNMKKYGGCIPGIRAGKPTEEYLAYVLSRLTAPGSLYLAVISLIPAIAFIFFNAQNNFPFGGTSILIVVGVGLDTVKQIESQLQQRNYEGFLR